jgi:hypothetical protein
VFVSADGRPYGRFARALSRGKVDAALEAAAELQSVSLEDALDLCLLMADAGDQRYPQAARRWLERFSGEGGRSIQEIVMAGAALAQLQIDPSSQSAREVLKSQI